MVRLGSHKFKRRHQYHKRNTYRRMDASWWTDSMLAIAASWCVVAVVEEESVVIVVILPSRQMGVTGRHLLATWCLVQFV